jgi:act minimal PKS acyl carrier protein
MSGTLTFPQLRELVHEAAGDDESITFDEGQLDTTFESLGYDSLAFMETVSRIERAFGVDLPEEDVMGQKTPRALIDFVNDRISAAR